MIIVKLLTKKRQLVDRLQKPGLAPDERAEHETVLAKIDTALDLLEPAITRQKQQGNLEAMSRRGRGKDEQTSRSANRREMPDPQHALALVRWRQKVRRNG
jgi:hypothetical protein